MRLLDVARESARVALARGAQEAAVRVGRTREIEVAWRDGSVERLAEATSRTLSLDLYVDGRYAHVSTGDLRPEAIEVFVEESVALARSLQPDPFRRLPDPELYRGRSDADLETEDSDFAAVDSVARRRIAEEIEAAARAAAPGDRIRTVSSQVMETSAESVLVHTNGFEGTRRGTYFVRVAGVTASDPDGRRPEDHAVSVARFRSALDPPDAVGRRAAERALGRIGSVKGPSGRVTLVIDARAAGRLVSHLLAPLTARSLQQRRSFLEGRLGEAIASPLLSIRDDPLVPRGLGSCSYDDEALATRPREVVEKGVLRSWYVDTYYGRKLGIAPTTARPTNLHFALGTRSRDELVADAGEGVLVTGFLGGNCNGTTGDFSVGVEGYAIRGGRAAEPVGEMNVAGNHLELWKNLVAVGNDPHRNSPLHTPTLVFEGVPIAGR